MTGGEVKEEEMAGKEMEVELVEVRAVKAEVEAKAEVGGEAVATGEGTG